jgi:LEA14-like dessication related protein
MLRFLSLASLLLATTGCKTLMQQAFASPVVSVTDVRIRNIGLSGGTIDVALDIQNPNEYRIDAEKISYNFFVDTTKIVSGEITQRLTLEEKGKTSITIPVNFDNTALQYAMRAYLMRGALDYKVDGLFTLITPVGRLTRPYSGTGRVAGMP